MKGEPGAESCLAFTHSHRTSGSWLAGNRDGNWCRMATNFTLFVSGVLAGKQLSAPLISTPKAPRSFGFACMPKQLDTLWMPANHHIRSFSVTRASVKHNTLWMYSCLGTTVIRLMNRKQLDTLYTANNVQKSTERVHYHRDCFFLFL